MRSFLAYVLLSLAVACSDSDEGGLGTGGDGGTAGTGALADRKITSSTRLITKGYLTLGSTKFYEWNRRGWGPCDIYCGFGHSSDTFFFQLAGKLGIETDARLDDYSTTRWYVFAAAPAFVHAYLNGNRSADVQTRLGFDVDGVEWRIRHDFAATALDWRLVVSNPGAAS